MNTNVKANPDFPEVEDGCNRLAQMDRLPEVYVGLGGGSAIDTATCDEGLSGVFGEDLRAGVHKF